MTEQPQESSKKQSQNLTRVQKLYPLTNRVREDLSPALPENAGVRPANGFRRSEVSEHLRKLPGNRRHFSV